MHFQVRQFQTLLVSCVAAACFVARVCNAPCQSNFCVLGGVGVATLGGEELKKVTGVLAVWSVRGRRTATGSKRVEVRVLLNGREWDGRQLGRTCGAVPLGQVYVFPAVQHVGWVGRTGEAELLVFGEGKTVLIGAASKLGSGGGSRSRMCARAWGTSGR